MPKKAAVTLVCHRDSQSDNWKRRIARWECRLSYEGRKIDVGVMISYDLGSPRLSDVLSHLIDEAATAEGRTLDEWREVMGLERSKETNDAYQRAVAIGESLKYLFGDDLDEIVESVQATVDEADDAGNPSKMGSVDDYAYDGMTLKQLVGYCHSLGLMADNTARRHRTGPADLRAAIQELDWSSSTAGASWSRLTDLIRRRDIQKAVAAEIQAKRDHQVMLGRVRNLQSMLAG